MVDYHTKKKNHPRRGWEKKILSAIFFSECGYLQAASVLLHWMPIFILKQIIRVYYQ